jgi:hypothetical protein
MNENQIPTFEEIMNGNRQEWLKTRKQTNKGKNIIKFFDEFIKEEQDFNIFLANKYNIDDISTVREQLKEWYQIYCEINDTSSKIDENKFQIYIKKIYQLIESFDISASDKKLLESDLLRIKLYLEQFFQGSLEHPNPVRRTEIYVQPDESIYIHIFKKGKHILEVRISGHRPEVKTIYAINRHKFHYLFIDTSVMLNLNDYEKEIDNVRKRVNVPQQVYYKCMKSKNNIVYNILNVIVDNLLQNQFAQSSKDRLQIQWSVGEV